MPRKKDTNKLIEYDEHITKKGDLRLRFKKGKDKTTITFKKDEIRNYPYMALRQIAFEYAKQKLKLEKGKRRGLNPKTFIKYNLEPTIKKLDKKLKRTQAIRSAKIKATLGKLPRITTYLKAGESQVTIKPDDIIYQREQVYNKLLKPVVKHNGLISSLMRNTQDWKHYLTYKIRVEGIDNKQQDIPLGIDANSYQTRTIEEVRELLAECGVQEEHYWDSATEQRLREKGVADIRYLTRTRHGTIHNIRIIAQLKKARNT